MNSELSAYYSIAVTQNSLIRRDDPDEIFLSFLIKIGSYYVKGKRSLEFIQHLLQLDIFVTLEYINKKFGKDLKNFIVSNRLQLEIERNDFWLFCEF